MAEKEFHLQQIKTYLEKINAHFQNVLIPGQVGIKGNITISITFDNKGNITPQFSVVGEIAPMAAIQCSKDLIESLLDSAVNVNVGDQN